MFISAFLGARCIKNGVTSVVTNLDDVDTEEENPLDRKQKFKIYLQRNSRYK
ncbi:hypothetical protein RhiirC2_802372 [Rhizophagus irregularis]|uniref:Uncharacterized protein n=1 Tax=Rhizophagus irregularis TaxID=588596 RepID=A0A2N1M1B8_9GLOM|nr:hypothetical protein RhiirC2_802372 [Rhizophagus irregularis]